MKKTIFLFALPAIALLLGASYVLQINSLTALAYHSAETQRAIQRLSRETAALEMQARGGISPVDLRQLAAIMQFEKVDFISYISPVQGSVAQHPE